MNPSDYDAFCEVVVGFAELKGKQLSPPAIELYWRAMQHWPLANFRAAAEQLLRTCEFMPTPYDFEALRRAAARPTAGEAFAQTLELARNGARDGDVRDPLLARAIRAVGGMEAIRMSNRDEVHFLERRFTEHFQSIVEASEHREALPELSENSSPVLPGPKSAKDLM